jgi:ribose 5-phosphate isomerase A
VEVVPTQRDAVSRSLGTLGASPRLRRENDSPYVTDNGNWILDADFGGIENPAELAAKIDGIPGVVSNGIFPGLASRILVGDESGVREWRPPRGRT